MTPLPPITAAAAGQCANGERCVPESVMRAIFELAPVAVWITDGARVVFANRACAALFGTARPDELVGREVATLLAEHSRERVAGHIAQAQRAAGPVVTEAEHIARLDGGQREVQIALSALPDHGASTVQMVLNDITEQTRARQALERTGAELRRLSTGLVAAREEERRNIARELHDELGQRLTALKMDIATLGELPAGPAREQRVQAMLAMVDDTVASVRRLSADLRPPMLDDLGLHAAIEWLAQGWAARMGVQVQLALGPVAEPLPEGVAIGLYRMVQESLTNVARHACATQVRIGLQPREGALVLTVEDNGVGLAGDALGREGKLGLMGMRERAHSLGGELRVSSPAAGGTRVTVRLPRAGAAA